jgi:hypothetical protein
MSIRGDDGHVHIAGNLGVGIVSPSWRMHVSGSAACTEWFRTVGDGGLYFESHGTGVTRVSGDYGSVQTFNSKNGWAGFSIEGRYVFMSANNEQCGIYNDVDNQWVMYYDRGTRSIDLRQSDAVRLSTQSYGINIPNQIQLGDKYPNVARAKLYIRVDAGDANTQDAEGRGLRIGHNSWTNYWDITHRNSGQNTDVNNHSADLCYVHAHPGLSPSIRCIMRAYGNNVTLNFTGQHRSNVIDKTYNELNDLVGLIVVADKNDYIKMSNGTVKGKNAITISEALPIVSLCITEEDKRCFGVICMAEDPETRQDEFGNIIITYKKEKGDTRAFINSIGEGAIWVTDKNGTLESGDYITSCSVPGYGMKQEDEYLYNYTVAKITMDCDFTNPLKPKYKIKKEIQQQENTPVVISEGEGISSGNVYDEDQGENILDENGNLIWEEELDENGNVIMIESYDMRYLLPDGTQITKEEYDTKKSNNEEVYKAAFVGCTYHCG